MKNRLLLLLGLWLPLHGFAQKARIGFIPVGALNVHYTQTGSGKPVLLLHAGFLDHRMWEPQTAALSAYHRVITIDLPGHGRTQGKDTTVQVGTLISAVFDQLKVKQADVVGVSLGATCALDFALTHPGRVRKLVLVSAGLSGWESRFPLDSLTRNYFPGLLDRLNRKDTAGAAEYFTRFWFDGPYRQPAGVDRAGRRYTYETTLRAMQVHKISGWPRFSTGSAIDRIDRLTLPVLLIDGDRDLPYILAVGEYLSKNLKNARLIVLPGAGHMLNLEQPRRFSQEVLPFIDSR
ncbi:alpha/beta fold hydrolase [Larkinella soli]|uniref:alpha/beta fold hydrolase n=1 Tax=Larkinella soli TaxID=1770527 RepID=UPI000FFC6CA5|nr:alpha/beta hydrolase [Larkinella soli]